jgi:aspartyl-tRNA(Asn)/glutamyl-tRNA(Gln) amidotransferase subunit C
MAPPLTETDVLKIAELARLALTPEEIALFTGQLASILTYASEIQQADTSGVEPTSHVLGAQPVWREDEPAASLDRTSAFQNAPDAARDAGLFRVPKVL